LKAIRVHEFGGPEVLRLESVPDPVPGPGGAVVRIRAAALNHLDLDVRAGRSGFDVQFPYTPGFEAVGEIEALGDGPTSWSLGDRVLVYLSTTCGHCRYCRTGRAPLCEASLSVSLHTPGAFAEGILCAQAQLVDIPDALGFRAAAAIEVAFGTAWHMLFSRAGLRAGETVLVNSAGSGVGSAAIQLAKYAGAFVIGTSSSDEKLEQAKTLGMDVGINYTTHNVVDAVMKLTDGGGVDLVYEHVGGALFQTGLDALAKDGRLVTCGAHAGEVVSLDIVSLFRTEKRVIGSFCYTQDEVVTCLDLAARGLVVPVVHQTVPLEATREAMAGMERREQFGKFVIEPS